MDDNSQNNKRPDPKIPKFNFNNKAALISLVVLIAFFIFFFVLQDTDLSREIPYSMFLNYLDSGRVRSVKILDGQIINGEFTGGSEGIGNFKTFIPLTIFCWSGF